MIGRRTFCRSAASAVAGIALSGCRSLSGSARWYKGMLHCHTYWSDGRGFPEDVCRAYRDIGYDFLSITDHNRIGRDADCWRPVKSEEGPWPPQVSQAIAAQYRRTFASAQFRKGAEGAEEVRLQPFGETWKMFAEPGRFLLMPGVEVTRSMPSDAGNSWAVHVNCVNVTDPIPGLANEGLISECRNVSVREMIGRDFSAWRQATRGSGAAPSVFILNHPHWPVYDVTPEDLIALPQIRYFEICNNGADAPVPEGVPDDGWSNDRLWDTVNAVRAERGERMLFAVASDDTHWYPGNGGDKEIGAPATPGDGFVCVRSEALTPESLFAAMDCGDFYASSGVDLDEIAFDGQVLSVRVPARPGVRFVVKFIVSRHGFEKRPQKEVSGAFSHGRTRRFTLPGRGVGEEAHRVEGCLGRAVCASYTLSPEDLYVRARVESDEPSFYQPVPFGHPKVRCAWTQPYRTDDRI